MLLNIIIKPTHFCNFNCKYCYNEDLRTPLMTLETLENVIKKSCNYIKNNNNCNGIDFIWHGGEPLINGIDFFRNVIELEKLYSKNLKIINSIQTNGFLLDKNWIDFFQKENFKVSISLDGPKKYHDKTRTLPNNVGTFDRVMQNINLLKKTKIDFGVILVLTKINKDYVEEIYNFLSEEKLSFHFIPLTKQGSAITNFQDLYLSPNEYAKAWIKLYDKWFESKNDNYISCKEFINKSASVVSNMPLDCTSVSQCSLYNISIDPHGDVYPCSTFSSKKEWCYGNINEKELSEIMLSSSAEKITKRKINDNCLKCQWRNICNGGCYSRAYNYFNTIHTKDYYCLAFKQIFSHISKKINNNLLSKKS